LADWAGGVSQILERVWKAKSKDFSDRVEIEQAHDVLVSKVKTVDKDANCDTVAKRINSLRMTVGPFTGASKFLTIFITFD
jgi:hypothetical protein